jgi:hypothetical protein
MMKGASFIPLLGINPENGNEVAWITSQLSAVVWKAGANGVFFNSPTG